MKEYQTTLIKPLEEASPNLLTGQARATEFIDGIRKGTVSGEFFVYTSEFSGRAFALVHFHEFVSGKSSLFKPLRAFGISDTLNFIVTSDRKLYVPTKIYNVLQSVSESKPAVPVPSTMESSILGLIDYMTGTVYSAAKTAGIEFGGVECTIENFSDFQLLDKAWSLGIYGTIAVTYTTMVPTENTYDLYTYTRDGHAPQTLAQLRGCAEVRAVSVLDSGPYVEVYDTPGADTIRILAVAAALRSVLKIPDSDKLKIVRIPVSKSAGPTTLLTPVCPEKEPVCDELSRTRFATAYGFKFKGMATAADFEVESIREAYKDDPIAQELYKAVPEFYADIDLKNYKRMIAGIASGAIRTAMFFGESGTGKSTVARAMFNAIGIPYAVLNCSVNIEESDIVGTMIPNPEKKCADDPEFIWKDGILTVAARYGYGIVIEEINFARPGVLGLLNSLLDDAHTLYLPNGESVVAHKNFRMIATGNLGYEGTNRLNAALVNRFNVVHTFDTPNERETMQILKNRTGFENTEQLQKLYNAVVVLRKYIKDQNLSGTVSLRQLLNLVQCGAYYRTMNDAFVDIVLQGALLEYPEYFTEFRTTVLKTLGLDFTMSLPEG